MLSRQGRHLAYMRTQQEAQQP
ncbi:protein of unknown function [Cyanobium sp. NIES-981]|nr:protein of unknown function [Cyanobium sp. NIES-981]